MILTEALLPKADTNNLFEITVANVTHDNEEVNRHVIESDAAKELVVYVAEVPPEIVAPFFSH